MGACASSTATGEPHTPAQQQQQTAHGQGSRRQAAAGGHREATNERRGPSFAAAVVGWDKDFPPLTASQLASRRCEFWDTRVQGRAEMWQALRVACEASAEEGTVAAVLESAALQPFDMDRPAHAFTYDALGFKYEVPLYCMYTPGNLIRDTAAKPGGLLQVQPAPQGNSSRYVADEKSVDPSAASSASAAASSSIAAPASSSSSSGKPLSFRVRFSNGLPDLTVDQHTGSTIGQVKEVIAAKYPELSTERTRLFYLGKHMSSNSWSLGDIGMKKEMVLQCFVPGVTAKQTTT